MKMEYCVVGKTIGRETDVECYFPTFVRAKKFIALSSRLSGDCLYSSASLLLFGDNSACNELRIMTCIELFTNFPFPI